MDIVIRNTHALTMRGGALGSIESATIGVDDGDIDVIGPADEVDVVGDREIDGRGTVTLPGFVDVHAHTGLTLLRGGAQDVPEIEWMNQTLGPFAEAMTEEDAVSGARLGVLEAVRSGVTTVGEYAADVARLVEEVYLPLGVGVAAAETINAVDSDRGSLGPDDPYPMDDDLAEAGLERNEALFDQFDRTELVTPMYGPQALDMVPTWLVEEVRDRSRSRGRSIHMHVAQGEREQRQIEAQYGDDRTTIGVLSELGVLNDRLLAAHLHGASRAERRSLADAGVRMAANPSSIVAIDGIVPPIVEYRDAGGTAGIGTDQAPGPGGHDFVRELRTAALVSKADRTDPTAFPAWEALRVATIEGAAALGIDDRVGSLERGKRADLLVCDLSHPSIAPTVTDPFETVVPNLIYGATSEAISNVFVDGTPVVEDRTLVTADSEAIVSDAQERAERVFEEAGDAWRAAGSRLAGRFGDGTP
ncbi:amidohydrolase family protein [Halovivax gelatinilyticus]|uniref:amidohydrolase family protein n=1 Tax=Halovivax gelatinilyticus TaxID=2961597 RepID=UPI0020CA93A7|nr:amidohydrolase family protein [Halovivax gelatinilyticus]